MKNKALTILSFLMIVTTITAEAPSGYYSNAEGTKGASLKTALSLIIDGHTNKGYDGLYTIYRDSDDKNGKVWDMYSTCTWTHGDKKCGQYKNICDCYNREHTIPQSWFDKRSPMVSDAHHVVPTDGKVNGMRSNYPHGETNAGAIGGKGLGKVGSGTGGYSGKVYEPVDEYKGDIARMYFYFVTRYQSNMSSIDGAAFQKNTYPSLASWFQTTMLKWHREDPVSQKELDRNDGVYKHQRNRNPFIDHPELAEHIWGNKTNINWIPGAPTTDPFLSEPRTGSSLEFDDTPVNTSITEFITVKGINLTGNLNVSISGDCFSTTTSSLDKNTVQNENGSYIAVKFTPNSLSSLRGTLTISGGGLENNITVHLTGKGTNDFKAVDASNFTTTSFNANWSTNFDATGYTLNVFYFETSTDMKDTTFFSTTFANETFEDGVTDEGGYSNFENGTLRMGSSNNGCEIALPALDLTSETVNIVVNAQQYGSDSDAKLYLAVNGEDAGSIKTGKEMAELSAPIGGNSANSVISISANKKQRVYLQDIKIVDKGAAEIRKELAGYPQNVGNVLSHTVSVPNFDIQYHYNVTSTNLTGSNITSNTIRVTYTPPTNNDFVTGNEPNFYNSNNSVVIEGLEEDCTINVYSINGSIISSTQSNGNTATIDMNGTAKGIYVFRIQGANTNHTFKIAVSK